MLGFRRCLAQWPVVLAVSDRAARYVWIYGPYFNCDSSDPIGKTDVELADNPGTHALFELKQRVLAAEQSFVEEIEVIFGGQPRVYEITASPLHEDGVLVGVSTVGLDVTTRRAASEIRCKMREEQLRLISHDLRQPLNVIGMVASRLASDVASGPLVVSLSDRIKSNVRSMSRVIEDILDSDKPGGGELELHCEPTALGPFLCEILQSGVTPDSLTRVHLEIASAGLVRLDRGKISRAVLNLIDNALKFSPPNTPITVRVTREDSGIRIAVTDQGVGLDRQTAAAAFEKYWASPGSRASGGKGLGLYSARLIVEAHGGHCRVESVPGRGATFWIELSNSDAEQRRVRR